MKIEHVAINVPDPAGFAQWLVANLGMRIVVSSSSAPYMHFVADEAGSMFELYHNTAAPVPNYEEVDPFNLHFAFSSSDIDVDCARLVAAGATQLAAISTNASGDRLVFLRAPGGVPVQLVQRKQPLL